jgi:elongator complex protein 1
MTVAQVNGLEQSLAWRPSGNLIASTQRLPHRHDVVFFERNGLRHGEFTLPFAQREMHIVELAWSCDSAVLAVWLQPLDPARARNEAIVQLYTVGNYHWYLKQECV